jgi:hypothetical protein
LRISLLLKAWQDPPRLTGAELEAITTIFAPFSTAAFAQTKPDVPAPIMTASVVIVSLIWPAEIGGGGISKEYVLD